MQQVTDSNPTIYDDRPVKEGKTIIDDAASPMSTFRLEGMAFDTA